MPKTVSGLEFPDNWTPFMVQLFLFYWGNQLAENPYRHPSADGSGWKQSAMPYTGEGRFDHFKALVQMVFPKMFEWNEWSEKIGRALCENKHTAICGCGGSSKSTTTAMYAFFWYIAAPNNSAVLIASTTIEAAKKRIWKEIRRFYVEFVRQSRLGETVIVNSPKPAIRASQTDTAHGIYVVAVTKGEEQKGIDALKGFHPDRLLMIGDETDSISQAVVDVGANQEIGTIEYQTVWLGNDPSLFNPLGKMMQPEIGKAVGLEHVEWVSTNGTNCLRFDGYDSPNIRDKDKWKGIIRKKDIDNIIAKFGDNTPQVWIMIRGIHPPEGVENTILSEALFLQHRCQDKVTWKRSFKVLGLLDPAFGGDRCVFRPVRYGEDSEGKTRAEFQPPVEFNIDVSDAKTPAEHQIARKTRTLCDSQGIRPEDFYMDGTGTGRGVVAVLRVEWSPSINVVEFGGSPSDMPISDEESSREDGAPKTAKEEYDRKVTELWFSFRVFVRADIVRGLDAPTGAEFCSRRFELKARKTCVETKEDMKKRGIKSPDLADCSVIGVHALRERGVSATITSQAKEKTVQDYASKMKEHDIDGWNDTYSDAMADVGAFDSY